MKALRMFIWLTILTGLLYPLAVTGIGQTMHAKATGSLVRVNGKVVGSSLIGQKFEDPKYFWPRPSAVDYNTLPSGGSNLAATSATLKQAVDKRKEELKEIYHVDTVPVELVYASGSGLDPHISVSGAYLQIDRVARVRNKERSVIKAVVDAHIKKHFFGPHTVNVLLLNLALEDEKND